ncbi:hypothetical protein [uncultured Ruminococcus sp.]|uniref:hypothetical protein n=1 Tax=uncultured Ruminococcus sp. TaxID=165186 RepID=UPI0025F0D4A9|nr:hypothetical protein [uncultured Ruminococcus sp.]
MQKYCNIVKNKLNAIICNMEKNISDFVVDPKRDFVRKSELSFSKTMRFILGMGSQALSSELMEFYGLSLATNLLTKSFQNPTLLHM